MNIAEILEAHATDRGELDAIVERGGRITFAQLNAAATRAASDFARRGLSAGMRALVVSPMSIGLYATVVGLFRLGVTAVFVDPSAGSGFLARALARVRADAFVGVPRAHLLRLTSPALRRIPIKILMRHRRGQTAAGTRITACADDAPAIITFTSGTTGEPKAVVRTHGFLRAQHRAIVDSLNVDSKDVDLTTLPIFLLANLASGITSVIPDADLRAPGTIDGARLVAQIQRHGVTRTVASPALLERLIEAGAAGPGLVTLRKIFTGGAPVFPRTLDALAQAAPHASVVAVYGSTEAEPIASIDREEIRHSDRLEMRSGAGVLAGHPTHSIQLRVIADRWGTPLPALSADELDALTADAKTPGEIVVSGDHVLGSYLGGVGNEESKISVGSRVWHRTGDAGYLDSEGRLWLLGRCAAKVADAHGVQYPLPVECAASHVAGVHRAALVMHQGRRVLVIEADDRQLTLRDLLFDTLHWAHLSDVIVVPRIPVDRRHNAKVELAALQRMLPERRHDPRLRTDVLSSPGSG